LRRSQQISLVRIKKGRASGYETFAQGWLRGLLAWGRPEDVLVMPDGALLASDDKAGAVYRISYKKSSRFLQNIIMGFISNKKRVTDSIPIVAPRCLTLT
jgi:hypothetical protein